MEKIKELNKELLEELANLEHIQWVKWRKAMEEKHPELPKSKFTSLNYAELSEYEKNLDRRWAKIVFRAIEPKFYLTYKRGFDNGFLNGFQKGINAKLELLKVIASHISFNIATEDGQEKLLKLHKLIRDLK